MPEQLVVGKRYWIDDSTVYVDSDENEYAQVYLDEEKKCGVGNMCTSHFETVGRFLLYGESLENFVNGSIGHLLKDIIAWCEEGSRSLLADALTLYIYDKHLDIPENMEKEFLVKSTPAKYFIEQGMEAEYDKYVGYSLYCVD